MYTTNKVQAACIKVTQDALKDGRAQAVVVNSGNANACTGEKGIEDAEQTQKVAAELLGIRSQDVVVASTGVIGVYMPMELVEKGIALACSSLSKEGDQRAAEAIMTTDTVPKMCAVEVEIGGSTVRIGAMAKGSGMIHPNMATMLAFITTDADISVACLSKALKDSVDVSFNMISVDKDTSTNDMVVILANGLAQNKKIESFFSEEYHQFKEALDFINKTLAQAIARDGEGATKLLEVRVMNALTEEDARKIARSVVSSNLFKTAVFGLDANWGRILCAAGYSGGEFDPDKVDVYLGRQMVAQDGRGIWFSEEMAREELDKEKVEVLIDLKQGTASATAWGCDLTYDYIKINASYRS